MSEKSPRFLVVSVKKDGMSKKKQNKNKITLKQNVVQRGTESHATWHQFNLGLEILIDDVHFLQ